MKKCLLLVVLSALLAGALCSCKNKKISLAANDDKVNIADFLAFFPPLKLPYAVGDTILRRKEPEADVINYSLFTRLIPDSILLHLFGHTTHPHLYAMGKIRVPDAESYLFVKAVARDRRALYILCFDKKDRFGAARPVLYADESDVRAGVTGRAEMDNKYVLTLLHQRRTAEGIIVYHKDAYVYNEDTGLLLILTESNEAKNKIPPVYNPIDTLPRKHKYSGDYYQSSGNPAVDKRNLVAIRDGRDGSRFLFFIHFEKEEGTCNGELKGEAKFVSAGVARYRSYSDPCALEFSFGSEGVSIKETGGCGVHRDIKCFFEGYYERRKTTKGRSDGQKPGHLSGKT
ncbi:MAG TPA: hypothetical protein VGS79_03770 [Puia sp.]|nr:hypothetical protein [Puia sp.]